MSRHFSTVTGVEISARLVPITEENIRRLGITNVRFVCADAASFTSLDHTDLVYLFNPFPASVLAEVLVNLRRSLQTVPRPLWILYKNPVCHDVILQAGFTYQRRFAPPCSHPFSVYTWCQPPNTTVSRD
jgi:16S rRNA G966 N2-methylase RsmD